MFKKKLYFFFLFLLVLLPLVNAPFGYDNSNLPKIIPEINITYITQYVNNTNKTNYWDSLDTPADINHNDLGSLQGGQAGEYYHLNQSFFDKLVSDIFNWMISETDPFWSANVTALNTSWLNTTNLTYMWASDWNATNTSYMLNTGDTVVGDYTFGGIIYADAVPLGLDVLYSAEIGNHLTVGNNLIVDTNTLFVNSANSRVGIGTTTPQNTLNIVGDLNVTETLYVNDVNISNSSFSFTHNENNSIKYSVENTNSGSNATALIVAMNNLGNVMGIGIGSSNYLLGSLLMPNITGLYSRSKGDSVFLNFFNQAFIWMVNPSNDNDPENLVEVMRLDEDGLNVSGNIISDNVFTSQYIYAHNNATLVLASASVWANLTFDQEVAEIKKGISHTHDDNTNHTFTISEDGVYNIDFNFDVIDTSASSTDIDVAGRVIHFNGTEIDGSVFEADITKKNIETEISHSLLARFVAGDIIVFQFVAEDVDVQISTHGTYGDHPESATVRIEKVANL